MQACLDLELQELDVVDDLVQHRRLVSLQIDDLSSVTTFSNYSTTAQSFLHETARFQHDHIRALTVACNYDYPAKKAWQMEQNRASNAPMCPFTARRICLSSPAISCLNSSASRRAKAAAFFSPNFQVPGDSTRAASHRIVSPVLRTLRRHTRQSHHGMTRELDRSDAAPSLTNRPAGVPFSALPPYKPTTSINRRGEHPVHLTHARRDSWLSG